MNDTIYEVIIRGRHRVNNKHAQLNFVVIAPENATKVQLLDIVKETYDLSGVNCTFLAHEKTNKRAYHIPVPVGIVS